MSLRGGLSPVLLMCSYAPSHLYSNRVVIQKSKVNESTPKKYDTKEFSFLCLPTLIYCIVIVSVGTPQQWTDY
jgi:hypothetical protein